MITENYTMTLYEIINNFYTRQEVEGWFKDYELSDYLTTEQIETITDTGVWTKDKLAKKIVDHFLMEQIGFETMGLFKQRVKITMNEIMESKLPLIYTKAIEYDPVIDMDYKETLQRQVTSSGTNTGTSGNTTNSSGLNVNSDTPQGQITKADILAGNYASSTGANENTITSSTTSSDTASNNTGESYIKTYKGNKGSTQKLIKEFRENIRAIDYEIIKELEPLFMIIY